MIDQDRLVRRVAMRLHEHLQRQMQQGDEVLVRELSRMAEHFDRIAASNRKLTKAASRQWRAAARRTRTQISGHLSELRYQFDSVSRASLQRPRPVASLRDLIADLRQLEEEFGGWAWNRDRNVVCVKTKPIELQGIELGRFEIQLHPEMIGDQGRPPYDVFALDPNPAAGNDHITHPHITDDRLCAGDATTTIDSALREGRLCDFFVMVRSVLETYNPDSPYVSLDQWYGRSCAECGYRTESDSSYFCEYCECDFCDECISRCECCEYTVCGGCLSECQACEKRACRDCLSGCADCGENCCASCLEDGICVNCLERKELEDEQTKEEQANQDKQEEAEAKDEILGSGQAA